MTTLTLQRLAYTLRGVVDTCVLRVRDGDAWTLDVAAQPVGVRPMAAERAELTIAIDQSDLDALGGPISFETVIDWIDSGRISASGSPAAVDRFRGWVHAGGLASGAYAELADWIRDPRFVFMNHGFVEDIGREDWSFLDERDGPWKYAVNLVRHVVDGVALEGRRLLDVGCGRGGACSYYARYHRTDVVAGLDLVPQNVAFCRAAHGGDRIRFVTGDAQRLPFGDATFDVVSNIESSHCYPSLERFFAEVRRVLRAGGVFCYTDNLNPGDDETRTALLERAGGRVLRRRNITREVALASSRWALESGAFMQQMIDADLGNEAFVTMFGAMLAHVHQIYDSGLRIYVSWQIAFD